ncbi:MAG: efflux transporter outer membrane subunit [Gammaproteobacteria bacterium]
MKLQGSWLVALSLVTGCTLGPDYSRPDLDVPGAYVESAPSGESLADMSWWVLFRDEQLQSLIRTALEENKDLGIALSRIFEAQANLGFVRADQFPFVDGSGRAGRGRQSREIFPGADTNNNFLLGADLAFEVDLWGRLRRATESARAELLSSEENYRNVTISLISSVASAYLLLRDFDQRLVISRNTLKTRQQGLNIMQARFDQGTIPELEVNQAEIEVAGAEVAVSAFERAVVQTENAIRILLGRNPGPVTRGERLDQQVFPPQVPAGLPSELLQRRPDVLSAEQQLAAQTARIGAAEALRFPSLSLTGFAGVESSDLSDLNSSDAGSWSISANVFAPIFNSGKLKANVEVERARTEQLLLNYEATVQQAFREVEDALVAVRTLRDEHAAQTRRVAAARNAARLSQARYDGGVVDYLEVLDSERTRFSAELDESETLQAYLNAIVSLYKALGGGWDPET